MIGNSKIILNMSCDIMIFFVKYVHYFLKGIVVVMYTLKKRRIKRSFFSQH